VLTIVINPGGRRRVVTIAEALYLFGIDMGRPSGKAARTAEERRRHKNEVNREYRRRRQLYGRGQEQ
jgi:hypothetical protein